MSLEFLDIVKWPITLLIGLIIFRKPICSLIKSTKDIEYHENGTGKKFKLNFVASSLNKTKEILEINNQSSNNKEPLSDPKESIIQAWEELEKTARHKLEGLKITPHTHNFQGSELSYLEYRGALSPKVEAAIQNMQMLRNQIAHYPSSSISEKDAHEYIKVIEEIEKSINSIQELPAVQLHAITMIMRNLTHLVDTGKHTHITIDEIHKHIEEETVLQFVADLDGASELKGILNSNLWKGFANFYTKSLKSIYYGYAGNERRKWGIENSGLCLLLAWTNEIIQMGSGWHPNENLSELQNR